MVIDENDVAFTWLPLIWRMMRWRSVEFAKKGSSTQMSHHVFRLDRSVYDDVVLGMCVVWPHIFLTSSDITGGNVDLRYSRNGLPFCSRSKCVSNDKDAHLHNLLNTYWKLTRHYISTGQMNGKQSQRLADVEKGHNQQQSPPHAGTDALFSAQEDLLTPHR